MMKNSYCKIYNFMAWKSSVFLVSIFLILFFCIIIITQRFNLGLDFTGGTLIEVTVDKNVDIINIRDAFMQSGFKKIIVQRLGVRHDFIIRIPLIEKNVLLHSNIRMNILNILKKNIMGEFVITRISWVGPTVSNSLIKNGAIALLVAAVCILLYITFRFEWRLAVGIIISLMYDTIVVIGILSLFAIEINSTVIAALMSAIGYSLNDKIVIFDRIRENFFRISNVNSVDIFNISISQVLHRTIITSVTTIIVLLVLLIFGGSILYEFSIILLAGVFIGTVSSIYIASALAFKFGTKREYFIMKR